MLWELNFPQKNYLKIFCVWLVPWNNCIYNFQVMPLFSLSLLTEFELIRLVEPSPYLFSVSHFVQIREFTECHLNPLTHLPKSMTFIWSLSWDLVLININQSLWFSAFLFFLFYLKMRNSLFFKFASPGISGVTLHSSIPTYKQVNSFKKDLNQRQQTTHAINNLSWNLVTQNHPLMRYTFCLKVIAGFTKYFLLHNLATYYKIIIFPVSNTFLLPAVQSWGKDKYFQLSQQHHTFRD